MAGVSNPRPAGRMRTSKLYYSARGNILNYVYTVKIRQQFRWLGIPLIIIIIIVIIIII